MKIDQKKIRFNFVQNQIIFALIDDYLFLKSAQFSSIINIQYISHKKERKNCLKNPIPKSKKPCTISNLQPQFQLDSIEFEHSFAFLGVFRVDPDPYIIQKHQESSNPVSVCSY